MSNFWVKLKKPILCLAPMANVTDAAFRQIIAKYGKPDVTWTEFVSTDGLCSVGKKNLLIDLKYSEEERPIVAQIFGSKPELYFKTAKLLAKLGFDGIDINMGCPDKNIVRQGSCAALIQHPKLAVEIIKATQKGAPNLPISVKTRIGFNSYDEKKYEEWITEMTSSGIAALTIHGRTKKEMSLVPAHWDIIAKGVEIAKKINPKIIVIGNGDVRSVEEAEEKCKKYKVDGVMIGRGIFGNPWLFKKQGNKETSNQPTIKNRLDVSLEHSWLFVKLFGKKKNFEIMKKHYKAYVSGFPMAKELRTEIMTVKTLDEIEDIIKRFKKEYPEIINQSADRK